MNMIDTSQKPRLKHLAAPTKPQRVNRGYSKFVRRMRLILPMTAVAIAGLVMTWSQVENTVQAVPKKEEVVPESAGRNELINPKFESLDDSQNPYSITAARAVQSATDPDSINLENPQAEMTLESGAKLTGAATSGAYNQKAEKLALDGGVKLTYPDYVLTTEKMLVDMSVKGAWADTPVHINGAAGTLDSSGLHADMSANQLIFTGPVKLILNDAGSLSALPQN
jgi:lipopolysaccharide export system protein LptC